MKPNDPFRPLRNMAGIIVAALLLLHFYFFCYAAFEDWHWTNPIADRLALNFARLGPLYHKAGSKGIVLFFLAVTLVGPPSPSQPHTQRRLVRQSTAGLTLYFGSDAVLQLNAPPITLATIYLLVTLSGLYLLYGILRTLAAQLYTRLAADVFNTYNESFPQMERPVRSPYAIHFPASYRLRGQTRNSIVSLPDIFRGTIIMGVPGSGKTRHVFRPMIQQSLANGMALFVYDLKYDDLAQLTYNSFLNVKDKFPASTRLYSFNFDDLSRSHRFNVLDPAGLEDISDAADMATTILYGTTKQGSRHDAFFIESAVNFFTAVIWFLRRYENGRYCTLPHLIELIQTDYESLLSILRSYPEIESRVMSFIEALRNGSMEQLQGQIDSAKIPLSALASPRIYYLLSASDFTLDINQCDAPKIICVGSNPQKQYMYGAVVSLLFNRLLKTVNKKGGIPCHIIVDEAPSFRALGLDLALAQARSNKVAITIGIQDLSQLRASYGRDAADTLFNLPANLVCGQASGDTARLVSERFGRILQEKSTTSTNSRDTSTSQTRQLDPAVPPSKIATLSSGEFVGIMADTPDQPIPLKAFHCRIPVDNAAIAREESGWQPLPVVRTVDNVAIEQNFQRIQVEVRQLVADRMGYLQNDPGLRCLIVTKKQGLNPRKQAR